MTKFGKKAVDASHYAYQLNGKEELVSPFLSLSAMYAFRHKSILSRLPLELVIRVLENLDARELVRCTAVRIPFSCSERLPSDYRIASFLMPFYAYRTLYLSIGQ